MRVSYISLLTAAFVLTFRAQAQDTPSPGESAAGCPTSGQATEIPAARIAEDLLAGRAVDLSKVIVTGSKLDVSNRIIPADFRLRHSVIRVPVILSFATFHGVVDMSGSCF